MRSIGVPENLLIFGERRNGGKPNSRASFILQAHFDEGAVAINYGVLRKWAVPAMIMRLIRFLRAAQGDIRKITNKIIKTQ